MAVYGESSVPKEAIEREISAYRREGPLVWLRRVECVLDGEIVGIRCYDGEGRLVIETPMRAGRKHGMELNWGEHGGLELAEPYEDGLLHGVARQWDSTGRLLGSYEMVRGSGLDVWRQVSDSGVIYISEIHSLKDGQHDGIEWWLDESQRTVWHERHWSRGELHGIERMWNERGRLARGYPRYWVAGERMNKRRYQARARKDSSLPPFREIDQRPERELPPELKAQSATER